MARKQKTVRELGGEIWAELQLERRKEDSVFTRLDQETNNQLIDFIMSVLARHVDTTIINDIGLEVVPRPIPTWPDNTN